MKKLSFFDKIIYFINLMVITLLLFSYFLPLISPTKIPVVAILTIFVPILIVVNFIFAIYWIIKSGQTH